MTSWETQVPTEHSQALRAEFQRRCHFGERYNMELMTSAKFIRLLIDCAVVSPVDDSGRVRKATADILFKRALLACKKGSDRIGFASFCTCLALVAIELWPDSEDDVAFVSMVLEVIANSPDSANEEDNFLGQPPLDALVALIFDEYKPTLRELFRVYTMNARPGLVIRPRGVGTPRCHRRTVEAPVGKGVSPASTECSTQVGSPQLSSSGSSVADWGDGVRLQNVVALRNCIAPNDRFSHMSLEQMLAMCRSLEIVPEVLACKDVVRAFHAAQGGARSGSSRHGFLSLEGFVDAMVRLALIAYSRQPYSEMYPEARSRVRGFLDTVMRLRPLDR